MATDNGKKKGEYWMGSLMFRTIVMGRAIDLHRNLANSLFPDRLSPEQLRVVRDSVLETVDKTPGMLYGDRLFLRHGDAEFDLNVEKLSSCGFVTKSFMEHKSGAALVADGLDLIMRLNDEDHVTFMKVTNGNESFTYLWQGVNSAAKALEKRLPFAKNAEYGYLAANPDNVGTGLRLACCFSFVGLYLMKEMDQVLRGLERLGFDVRPMSVIEYDKDDDPIEAPGFCYRIGSTQTTGRPEDIVERTDGVFAEVARQEQNARLRLVQQRLFELYDFLYRSVAVGAVALSVSESEALDILFAILFGIDMSCLEASEDDFDDILALVIHPIRGGIAHVTKKKGAQVPASEEELRMVRARIIRHIAKPFLGACVKQIKDLDKPAGNTRAKRVRGKQANDK